jgi:hypothetical protein
MVLEKIKENKELIFSITKILIVTIFIVIISKFISDVISIFI